MKDVKICNVIQVHYTSTLLMTFNMNQVLVWQPQVYMWKM